LRRRMIEDMTIRKFAQKTSVTMCSGRGTLQITSSALPIKPNRKMYAAQLHLASSGAGVPKINTTISAPQFFFKVTLYRPTSAGACRPHTSRGGPAGW